MNLNYLKPLSIIILAMSLLFSCTTSNNGKSSETTTDSTAADKTLQIVQSGISEYKIVRGEDAATAEIEAAKKLKNAILEYTGVELVMSDDFLLPNAAVPQKEILIGKTSRDESKSVFATLRSKDYAIKVVNDKLVIVGGEEAATEEAVDKFIADFLSGTKQSSFAFAAKDGLTHTREYPVDTLTINGVDISNFKIVYYSKAYSSEKIAVQYLADKISDLCGRRLEIVNDRAAATQHEILVGSTSHGQMPLTFSSAYENSSAIAYADGKLFLTGNNVFGTRYAIDQFITNYLKQELIKNKKIELNLTNELMADVKPSYSAMSFNILYSVNQPAEQHRKDLVIQTILAEMPDTVGLQECSVPWMNILRPALAQYYDVVGELNNKTQQWYNAIFYRKDKFRLIETKTQWLSATPSMESKLPESNQFRTVTYAVLEDLTTGRRYAHYNTHLDFADAQPTQINILIKILNKCDYPIVLTGDFNLREGTANYATITATKMKDSKHATDKTMNSTTYNDRNPNYGGSVIDYCYVTLHTINVSKYKVVNTLINGQYSSDHFPVYIEFDLSPQ